MRKLKGVFFVALLFVSSAALYNNCSGAKGRGDIFSSKETDLGNPFISLFFKPYSADAAFTNLTGCVKSLRLSNDFGEIADAVLQSQVPIIPTGTILGQTVLPKKSFNRVEMTFDSSCPSLTSLSFRNANGPFTSRNEITVSFTGSMTISDQASTLSFDIQALVDALNTVTAAPQIETSAEATTNTFTLQSMPVIQWTGAVDSNWTNGANWSGGVPPRPTEKALFNSSCVNCNAIIDFSINVGGILMDSTYTGTVTQSPSRSIDIQNGSWIVQGGTFVGSDSYIWMKSPLILSAGSFTSTSNFLVLHWQISSETTALRITPAAFFTHGNGTVIFHPKKTNCTASLFRVSVAAGKIFNDVTIEGEGIDSGCPVNGVTSGVLVTGANLQVSNLLLAEGILNGPVSVRGNVDAVLNYEKWDNSGIADNPTGEVYMAGGTPQFIRHLGPSLPLARLTFAPSPAPYSLASHIRLPAGDVSLLSSGVVLNMNAFNFNIFGALANEGIINRVGGTLNYGSYSGTGIVNP